MCHMVPICHFLADLRVKCHMVPICHFLADLKVFSYDCISLSEESRNFG